MNRVLGLIPARGGSKRLPGKNLADAAGRTLVQRAVDVGLASKGIDRLIVSTDDPAIAEAARAGGAEVPFMRPAELATDAATSLDVVRHAMDWADEVEPGAFAFLILLQPTSPLRTAQDVEATLALALRGHCPTAVTVAPASRPETLMIGAPDGTLSPMVMQGQPLRLNGAVYVLRWDHVRSGGGFIATGSLFHPMPEHRSIDIDTSDDLSEAVLKLRTQSNLHG